jgi:hypothetical protein
LCGIVIADIEQYDEYSGQIQNKGVIGPMEPHIYRPMLEKLEALGIRFVEKTVPSEEL